METDKWRPGRLLHVAALAAIVFVVATVLDGSERGLWLAGVIVVCELLWTAGSFALRSWRRQQDSRR